MARSVARNCRWRHRCPLCSGTASRLLAITSWSYLMKKTISMLVACAYAVATTGCGRAYDSRAQEEHTTCQKLHGAYAVDSQVSRIRGGTAACRDLIAGRPVLTGIVFDARGVVSRYDGEAGTATDTELCNTSYTNRDCTARIDCISVEGGGGVHRSIILDLNPEGTRFFGTFELNGWGTACPSVEGTLRGEAPPSPN